MQPHRNGKSIREWREVTTCLTAMILYGAGGGGFTLLIVGYLETQGVSVTTTGSVMSLMSLVEAIFSLLVGYVYRGRGIREYLMAGVILNVASATALAYLPAGPLAWGCATLNGAGFGVFVVMMYLAVIERRPSGMSIGLAVGLYTASIAAGNGLGNLMIGRITDLYGFQTAFLSILACYVATFCLLITLRQAPPIRTDVEESGPGQTAGLPQPAVAAWTLAMVSGFVFASLNVIYDVLFPIYALRMGMDFTRIGLLGGIKMVLAGVVRPFVGAWFGGKRLGRLNNASLFAMVIGTLFIPWAGMGWGLLAAVAVMGASFGAVRTTSATLAVAGETDPRIVSRKASTYNTCMTLAQTIMPWGASLLATSLDIGMAFWVGPLCLVALFGLGMKLLPGLAVGWWQVRVPASPAKASQE